jgi:CHAT domain-containing protein/tetratricopeptide (TPR) repeat protein
MCLGIRTSRATALLPNSCVALGQQQSIRLQQGDELKKQLKGGETHAYQVALLAGQFLSLIVDQQGIDVAVTLFTPEGKKVTAVDSLNSEYGPEPLVAIAETSGVYGIIVAAGNKESPPGEYDIRFAELRTPAPGDAEHVAAERNIERAFELQSTAEGNDWDAAITKLQEALQYYESAGAQDFYRRGLVLFTIGYLQAQKSRVQESIAAYLAALPLFQMVGDRIMEARTRNNLGGEYHDLGEPLKALQYHREALSLLPAGTAPKLQTSVVNNMGVLYEEMGDWTAALRAYERAASAFGELRNWREQAIAWRNVAYVYRGMDEPEQAMRYLDQARNLVQSKSLNDPTLQAEILTSRAIVLLSQGQESEALESAEQALKLRGIAGDARREGDTLSVLGSVYRSLQQPQKAQQTFQLALGKQQEADYRVGAFRTLLHMGDLDLSQQKSSQAQAELQQALNLAVALGCRECKVEAEFNLARVQQELGNFAQSLQQAKDTIENLEKLRAGIGTSALRASFLGGHEQAYELYIDLSLSHPGQPDSGDSSAQAFQISERSRSRSLLETLSGVRINLGQNDDQLAQKQQAVQNELAANAGQLLGLWQKNETRGSLRQPDVEGRIQELEAEYNTIEAEKAGKNRAYAALTQPKYLTARQVQEELLDEQTVFLEYYLGDQKSYLWAISRNAISVHVLPPRAQIETASRRFYELLKKHKSDQSITPELIAAASELSNLVLGPVTEELQNRRLVIAADGALQYIPFAALNQPGVNGKYQPLVLAHEIVAVPSASAMAAQREFLTHRTPAERSLAILADPVFSVQDPRLSHEPRLSQDPSVSSQPAIQSGNVSSNSATRLLEHIQAGSSPVSISRLPFTAIEAEKILAIAPARTSMKAVGFTASRSLALSSELGQYRYLHFATHGYMDAKHPELSALVLSLFDKNGKIEDGFLRLQDIYNLRLHADLVVLSACETGLGREIRGEGLIGLTRGFLYAGAARVLVSLWDVSDQGTSELMPRFYEVMLKKGKPPAAALREAQIAMFKSRKWQAPYYWAPFTLQGEWK